MRSEFVIQLHSCYGREPSVCPQVLSLSVLGGFSMECNKE